MRIAVAHEARVRARELLRQGSCVIGLRTHLREMVVVWRLAEWRVAASS